MASPTLFGLTGQQLAGIRGYTETCAGLYAIEALFKERWALAGETWPGNLAARRSYLARARETEASIQAVLKQDTHYAEGARFALVELAELRGRVLAALADAESEMP